MNKLDIIKNRRTVRKFENRAVELSKLNEIVEMARIAPYPANIQPLKFMIVNENASRLFPFTKWGAHLENGTPEETERPLAYIVTLGDTTIKANGNFETEGSIAGATMSYAAEALDLGTCWLGAIDREGIKKELSIKDEFNVVYLLAVGYKGQVSKEVSIENESVKYYLDDNNELCVPKRSFDEILYK